jgi:hypothetical protein
MPPTRSLISVVYSRSKIRSEPCNNYQQCTQFCVFCQDTHRLLSSDDGDQQVGGFGQVLFAFALVGLVQYIALNRSSVSFEAKGGHRPDRVNRDAV